MRLFFAVVLIEKNVNTKLSLLKGNYIMWKKAAIASIAFTVCLLISGCDSSGGSYAGQPHAVKLTWRATTDLNWFNERSHTLALYIVQAKKAKSLAKLAKSSDQLLEFVKNGKPDKDITSIDRITVQPGGMQSDYIDADSESTCIGVIAAYYYVNAPNAVSVFAFPTGADKRMSVDVVLGKEAILKATKTPGGDW